MRKFWQGFYYVIEKIIDQLETKMTDIDPSVAGQHVRPLKNNYFKACHLFIFASYPYQPLVIIEWEPVQLLLTIYL